MRTDSRTGTVCTIIIAAAVLLWPAAWNGYPLVFSDTGTYLSQAIEHYAGWDRPVFYSAFMLPLHLTLTTWPVIAVQAFLLAHLLHLTRRILLPDAPVWWLIPMATALAVTTPLPWLVSQLMPDIFTGALVLALALLVLGVDRLSARETVWLASLATLMIVAHLSHLPLALVVLVALRCFRPIPLRAVVPTIAALLALVSANALLFGRVSPAPFGNVFLLARVIYDGPGADTLHRECPAAGWRLCAFADRLPATWDDFLWDPDGPVVQAGGGKLVSQEADKIVLAALRAEPGRELAAFVRNTGRQLTMFATGDGLHAWPATVTPWLERDFPRFEVAAYAASRQNADSLVLPNWLQALHAVTAIVGIGGCLALCVSPGGRSRAASGLAAATLVALLANAAIAGGLSGPHDRYQARIMWLPPLVAALGIAAARPATAQAFGR
ncbi:MAG TPA: hypothetical protein VFL55_20025 [Acetobacteraceae bacterium]|nr:hypothetical protein [Acetobacteraceae bacterium]